MNILVENWAGNAERLRNDVLLNERVDNEYYCNGIGLYFS